MSKKLDLSIIIVHATGVEMLRQTLRGIRKASPRLDYEVIIVDNNTSLGLEEMMKIEFPEMNYIPMDKNIGFGAGMNVGIKVAEGKYILIFNPDIILPSGSLEELFDYMEKNDDVGVVGPKLLNADGSLQYSCYRLPTLFLPFLRRTPFGRLKFGQRIIDEYLMKDNDHSETMPVDSLLGGAMFTRSTILRKVGLFDERYFLYYEDNDLCRQFWKNGYKVMYHPRAEMMHYHRRATADGGLLRQLFSWITWVQISSFFKYMFKYAGEANPRLEYGKNTSGAEKIECAKKEVED